ncbi:MAG: tetratricopeptide repeat protein [Caldilineaceae bacterium]|nr:tetratricopeptide repeat protein [Caldilineaceae bacterium]
MQQDAAAIWQYAPRAEELAIRYGHGLYQAIAQRAWGVSHRLTGEYDDAERRLKQALGVFRELGARWQIGRTLFALGEVAMDRSNTTEAHNCFTQALAAFEEMQAAPDVARTRAVLRSLT